MMVRRAERLAFAVAFGGALVACGSDPTGNGLKLVALSTYDGGTDAGCTVASSGERVGCATAYEITGDPLSCPGFGSSGAGTTSTCESICKSGLVCNLSGVSDGTNAVACQATCASPEH